MQRHENKAYGNGILSISEKGLKIWTAVVSETFCDIEGTERSLWIVLTSVRSM